MDKLGQRIIRDTATIQRLRGEAQDHESEARKLRQEADELERLLELARFER
jgi:hypothetical protein